MAIFVDEENIISYGFCLVYDSHPPEGTELDEVGCISIDGYKTIAAMIKDIKKRDLVVDFNDQFILYGINKDRLMVVLPPLGCRSGEDFLESA